MLANNYKVGYDENCFLEMFSDRKKELNTGLNT